MMDFQSSSLRASVRVGCTPAAKSSRHAARLSREQVVVTERGRTDERLRGYAHVGQLTSRQLDVVGRIAKKQQLAHGARSPAQRSHLLVAGEGADITYHLTDETVGTSYAPTVVRSPLLRCLCHECLSLCHGIVLL